MAKERSRQGRSKVEATGVGQRSHWISALLVLRCSIVTNGFLFFPKGTARTKILLWNFQFEARNLQYPQSPYTVELSSIAAYCSHEA